MAASGRIWEELHNVRIQETVRAAMFTYARKMGS